MVCKVFRNLLLSPVLVVGALVLPVFGLFGSAGPKVGDTAPQFVAASTAGTIDLTDYRGQKHVVLAFYYADFTPA